MKKKIYLIQPTYRDRRGQLAQGRSLSMYSLTIPALSAAVPPVWNKEFCLEYFENVNYGSDASVVGLSSMGSDLLHAREIAAEFKRRGKVVLFGGFQPHFSESAISAVCDAVVHGNPGPTEMAAILRDVETGNLARDYHCGFNVDFPFDYSVLEGKRIRFLPLLSSVGCVNECEFCCNAALYEGQYRVRRVDNVLADLACIRRKTRYAAFVDANFYNNREYVGRLCSRMISENHGLQWGAQCTIDVADDAEALRLLRAAGCRILFVGLETLNQDNMDITNKDYSTEHYRDQIRRIAKAGIQVAGYFVLGLDSDVPSTFDATFDFIHDSRIALPVLNLLLPAPGTKSAERLHREGRLLVKNDEDFLRNASLYGASCNRCFYQPKQMSTEEAEDGYLRLVGRLSSLRETFRRSLVPNPFMAAILLMLNFEFRSEYHAMVAERAHP